MVRLQEDRSCVICKSACTLKFTRGFTSCKLQLWSCVTNFIKVCVSLRRICKCSSSLSVVADIVTAVVKPWKGATNCTYRKKMDLVVHTKVFFIVSASRQRGNAVLKLEGLDPRELCLWLYGPYSCMHRLSTVQARLLVTFHKPYSLFII